MLLKSTFLTFGLLIVLINHVEAARRVKARQRLRDNRDSPSWLGRKRSIRDAQTDGSRHIRSVFGLKEDESFEITALASTAHGSTQVKLKETFKGQDVIGASVTLTTDSDGDKIEDASGEFVQDIDEDISESDVGLSEEELFAILVNVSGDEAYLDYIRDRKIFFEVFTDSESRAHPVASVEYLIETDEVQKRPRSIISAISGRVLFIYDSLERCLAREDEQLFGGNKKIGKRFYDNSERCLDISVRGDMCYLENEFIKVVDMKNSASEPSSEAAHFECKGSYNDSINGAYSPAIDALYFGTQIVKMFREWYHMDPIEEGLVFRVHFSKNILNAYWNGHNVSFGDGRARILFPLVSLDLAAHEIAHGFTEQNSGLIYFGQSGGLNEAFSDITGEMAELYATNKTDWLVGADIMYRRPMRYFDDPTKDRRSIAHLSHYKTRLSPHQTSGIFNKVFYLLVHDYGVDPVEAFRVFLHANKMYWHPMSDFTSAACDVLLAAYDVAQAGEPFIRAFAEVGIDVCNVEDHVLPLRFDKPTDGISVSIHTKPVFMLELQEWSETASVGAQADNVDVTIDLFNEKWAQVNDSSLPLVSGTNSLTFNISDFGARKCLVRFSTSESTVTSVQGTANYSCKSDYVPTNFVTARIYKLQCG